MDFSQYSDLALRTCHLPPQINGRPNLECLEMASMGLSGEIAEVSLALSACVPTWVAGFDHANLVKEMGDSLWYLSLAAVVLGYSLEEIVSKSTGVWTTRFEDLPRPPENWWVKDLLSSVEYSGLFLDEVKKVRFHGHALDREKLFGHLTHLFRSLWMLSNNLPVWKVSLTAAAELNVARLQKRYPNGFTAQDSINRTS